MTAQDKEPHHSQTPADLLIVELDKALSVAYYSGLDKKGWSLFEEGQQVAAITQAFQEYVRAMKPELPATFASLNDIGVMIYKKATFEYEAALLAGLEEKSDEHN